MRKINYVCLLTVILTIIILGDFQKELDFDINRSNKYESNINVSPYIPSFADSEDFISVWNTSLISTGSSASDQIRLPLESNGIYNFTIYWGDNTHDIITTWDQGEITHTYTSSGRYSVVISGVIEGWSFNNTGDKLKIVEISQWGSLSFGNASSYFAGCNNLELKAVDSPNLSNTNTLEYTFQRCYNLGSRGNMNGWNVSNVNDMKYMFSLAENFNQNISEWDVSSVTDMAGMFSSADSFNQPLNSWDVSKVTNMASMFYNSDAFNQPLNNWDVSKVTNMASMFFSAHVFNSSIDNWNVSSVTSMSDMFAFTYSFNQDISKWDVSNVNNMAWMFYETSAYNQYIGGWNTSSLSLMIGMFCRADAFNQNISGWNISNVQNLYNVFSGAKVFNQDLSGWDVSSVTDMSDMFEETPLFNQNLSNWNVSSVIDMRHMFKNAKSFNQDLSRWDVSSVEYMSGMFEGASSFNQDLSRWDVSPVEYMSGMFEGASSFNQDLSRWDVSSVIYMNDMFSKATSFNCDIGRWNVSKTRYMNFMFYNATSFDQNISGWDVSSVKYMNGMFYNATSFNQDISRWDISSVTEMEYMFCNALKFDQDLGSWDVSSITELTGMFQGSKLTTSNYDSLLNSWSQLITEYGVNFDAGFSTYSASANASRQYLIDNWYWNIDDGGMALANPTKLKISVGYDYCYLNWTVPADYPIFPITGYNIYRSVNNTNSFCYLGTSVNTNYTDNYVKPENTYYYRVTRFTHENESDFSNLVWGSPILNTTPNILFYDDFSSGNLDWSNWVLNKDINDGEWTIIEDMDTFWLDHYYFEGVSAHTTENIIFTNFFNTGPEFTIEFEATSMMFNNEFGLVMKFPNNSLYSFPIFSCESNKYQILNEFEDSYEFTPFNIYSVLIYYNRGQFDLYINDTLVIEYFIEKLPSDLAFGFLSRGLNGENSHVRYNFIKITKYIVVDTDVHPLASFTVNATTIKENDIIQFTDTTINGNLPLSYQWDFGDGSLNSTVQNPQHRYVNSGLFKVILLITDSDGDHSLAELTIQVSSLDGLFANFDANITTISEGEWIQFTDKTTGGVLPLIYQWDFGDGSPLSNKSDPVHQYLFPGSYTVELQVRDTNGHISNKTLVIEVKSKSPNQKDMFKWDKFWDSAEKISIITGLLGISVSSIVVAVIKKKNKS